MLFNLVKNQLFFIFYFLLNSIEVQQQKVKHFSKFEILNLKSQIKSPPNKNECQQTIPFNNEAAINRVEIISLSNFNSLNGYSSHQTPTTTNTTSTIENTLKSFQPLSQRSTFLTSNKKVVTFNTQVKQENSNDLNKRYSSSYLDETNGAANKRLVGNKSTITTSDQSRSSLINKSNLNEKSGVYYSSNLDFTRTNLLENKNNKSTSTFNIEPKEAINSSLTSLSSSKNKQIFFNAEPDSLKLSKLSKRLESVREAFPLGTNIGIQQNWENINNCKNSFSKQTVSWINSFI